MAYSVGSPGFGIKAMIIAQLLQVLFPVTFAVDADCNYYQIMNPGVKYYVYNKGYPNNYTGENHCLWIAVAPKNYKIEVKCTIGMPQSPRCSQDKLLISLTGDPNFVNADTYCGFRSISRVTEFNNISIGLSTVNSTQGGRIYCTIKAKTEPNCNCGWKNTRRIVGGIETEIHEFPMMAGMVDLKRIDLFCGATIIARKYAVSAAHCFNNRIPSEVALLVGAHNITSSNNATKLMLLELITRHPLYDPKGNNDIAIIKTQQYIEYNMDVGPACLPLRYYTSTFAGESVEVLGWGTIEFTGAKSDVLLKTDMNVLSEMNCYSEVQGSLNQMCTYKSGHDSCQSDSGGPLLWLDPNTIHIQLVGVVSSGFGCASSKPSLNVRVTSYLGWIQSVTPDAAYCVK